ncbi:MAG: imidazole glycerol phosphate synthase subunit HisH [Prevotellaceae bacterium]|nr:imidazole glycerol phosphate synthase subunit HisH [Prevotellaceae bacterium]
MSVAIVKYNAGNIYSVLHALKRLGVEPLFTDDAEALRRADKVLFPGQGEAGHVMKYLHTHGLDTLIRSLTQPVLGICIGQQLLCRHSDEGNVDCLGLFDVPVHRFIPTEQAQKVPHIGWNDIQPSDSKLFSGIAGGEYVYYVHSYYVPLCPWTIARTDYIHSFSAALQKDNFYATQFHPEKSGSVGERILRNFLAL